MVIKNTSTKTSPSDSTTKTKLSDSKPSIKSEANSKETKSSMKSEPLNLQAPHPQKNISTATGKLTRIIAEFDTGFGNTLYIRGKGANLSWDKGLPMRNVKANEWVWESDVIFPTGEFKILINDSRYETGHNHALYCGTTVKHTPRF